MGRKNKRKKSEYRRRLGFNPMKYISTAAQSTRNSALASPVSTVQTDTVARVTTAERTPQRGDIWFADLIGCPGTCVQRGIRPVLVVSNDMGNNHSTIVNVLPMSSQIKKMYLPSHTQLEPGDVADSRFAFRESVVQAEQITTIGRLQLKNYVGRVEDTEVLNQITQAVISQLALQ